MNATNTTKNMKKRSDRKMAEKSDVIFVGNKPPMSYVLAIITAFSQGSLKEITLKARGQAITTAVDVAEITRSRFLKDLKVSKIAIGTAEMPPREGENRSRMVSTIEISLLKTKE
jgi:archaea-specific DNA-binding protein